MGNGVDVAIGTRRTDANLPANLHNLGDVWVSLAPVAAGVMVALTGRNEADSLIALGVGFWLAISTIREVRTSGGELLWPQHV